MTNEEVIEVLEKEESYMLSHGGDRQAKALRIAINKIEQEYEWIPVTERLPEEEGFYLVTRRITDDVATFIFRHTLTSKDYWERCVTAWMPLPQPYKAESENEK